MRVNNLRKIDYYENHSVCPPAVRYLPSNLLLKIDQNALRHHLKLGRKTEKETREGS